MKLVIDIPEEDYERCKKKFQRRIHIISDAIANGTPLPKEHGRLIDADELLKEKRCFEDFDGDTFNIIHEETVINAPTIIDADKESEEERKPKVYQCGCGTIVMNKTAREVEAESEDEE